MNSRKKIQEDAFEQLLTICFNIQNLIFRKHPINQYLCLIDILNDIELLEYI